MTIKLSCSIPECNGNAHWSAKGSRGYCSAHYQRLRKHGDPLGGGTSKGELLRWVSEVALRHTGGECLAWPFANNGYGKIRIDGKMVGAHRYICELVHGAPPTPGHEAAHSCGKGHEACVSPIHLSWKTHIENMADTLKHGTHSRGERCGRAKLTEAAVREILAMKGKETQREMAARFGVATKSISSIHIGRSWAWLSEEAAS